jgi:ribosomal protein S18 acetylase RimI-like enzyme
MLLAEAIKIMRENNLQSLMLTVNKQNHTAISAYRGTKQLAINL